MMQEVVAWIPATPSDPFQRVRLAARLRGIARGYIGRRCERERPGRVSRANTGPNLKRITTEWVELAELARRAGEVVRFVVEDCIPKRVDRRGPTHHRGPGNAPLDQ